MSDVKDFTLTPPERALLKSLTEHAGFPVLARMMDAACLRASNKVVACEDDKEVLNLQKEARATNAFCNILRKAINWNVQFANVTNVQGATDDRDVTSRFRPS